MELDVLIRGGMVFDGTGNPWFVADVGIKDGKVAAVGKLNGTPAVTTIDARGLAVAPGFVDAHAHSDYLILADPTNENKLLQGVTLDVAGNCGYSAAPIGEAFFKEWWVPEISERFTVCSLEEGRRVLKEHGVELSWRTMGEYLDAVDASQPSTNYLNFTGQVALRLATYGEYSRRPTDEEFEGMRAHLHEAMRAGSFGVSTESGSHKEMDFDVEELVELCTIAAEYGGVYSNHMRIDRGGHLHQRARRHSLDNLAHRRRRAQARRAGRGAAGVDRRGPRARRPGDGRHHALRLPRVAHLHGPRQRPAARVGHRRRCSGLSRPSRRGRDSRAAEGGTARRGLLRLVRLASGQGGRSLLQGAAGRSALGGPVGVRHLR
jgi:N-acyl-D-aspartate/D-glutamate deacylase